MQISKKYLSIVGASLIQGSILAIPDIEGTFVQKNEKEDLVINPIFGTNIINQLHYLMKRSYRITDRQGNAYNYRYPEKLTHKRSNSFGRITPPPASRRRSDSLKLRLDSLKLPSDLPAHCDRWIIHEPFTGVHGVERLPGIAGCVVSPACSVELDYPGFVAYLPREEERPPLIVVVL